MRYLIEVYEMNTYCEGRR